MGSALDESRAAKDRRRPGRRLAALFLLALAAGSWALERRLRAAVSPASIAAVLSETLGARVEVEGGTVSLWRGIALSDVRVSTESGAVLFAPRLEFDVSWRGLLARRIELDRLRAVSPRLVLRRSADGTWEAVALLRRLLSAPEGPLAIRLGGIDVEEGSLLMEAPGAALDGLSVDGIRARVRGLLAPQVRFSGAVGRIDGADAGASFEGTRALDRVAVDVAVARVPLRLASLRPAAWGRLSWATLEVRGHLEADGAAVSVSGEGSATDVEVAPAGGVAVMFGQVRVRDVSARLDTNGLAVRVGWVETDDLSGSVECAADGLGGGVRRVALRLSGEARALRRLPPAARAEAFAPDGPLTLTAVWRPDSGGSLEGEIEARGLSLAPPDLPWPLGDVRGRIAFSAVGTRIAPLHLVGLEAGTPAGRIILDGVLDAADPAGRHDLVLRSDALRLDVPGPWRHTLPPGLSVDGPLRVRARLRDGGVDSAAADLAGARLGWPTLAAPVAVEAGTARLEERSLRLDDLRLLVGTGTAGTGASGRVEIAGRIDADGRLDGLAIRADGVSLETLVALLPPSLRPSGRLTGAARIDVVLDGPPADPTARGEIVLDEVALASDDPPIRADGLRGRLALTGRTVRLEGIRGRFAGGDVICTGTGGRMPAASALTIAGRDVDLGLVRAAFRPAGAGPDPLALSGRGRFVARLHVAPGGSTGGAGPTRAEGTLAAETVAAAGLLLGNVDARWAWTSDAETDRLVFEWLRGDLHGGRLDAAGTLEARAAGVRLEGRLDLTDADLGALARALRPAAPGGEIAGRIDVRFEGAGRAGDPRSLEGAGSIDLRDARLAGLRPLSILSGLLRFRPLAASAYARGGATFEARRGRLSTRDLSLRADGYRVDAAGYVDVEGSLALDGRVTFRPSIAGDLLSRLGPLTGLRREANGSVSMGFRASGTLADPDVDLLAGPLGVVGEVF